MRNSYKILYFIAVAQIGALQGVQQKTSTRTMQSSSPAPAQKVSNQVQYTEYANTIKNDSEKNITVQANYTTGKKVGPIPLPAGAMIMLNEDLREINEVLVNQKSFKEGSIRGRSGSFPPKANISTISYIEDKKGARLVCQ